MSTKLFSGITDPAVGGEVARLRSAYTDLKSAEARYITGYEDLKRAIAAYEWKRYQLLADFCIKNNMMWCGLRDHLADQEGSFFALVRVYSLTDEGYCTGDKNAEILCRGCSGCLERFFKGKFLAEY